MAIDAIKNMSANEDVVTRSLIMLTNACFNNDLNRIIAKKLGAVEAIVIGALFEPNLIFCSLNSKQKYIFSKFCAYFEKNVYRSFHVCLNRYEISSGVY